METFSPEEVAEQLGVDPSFVRKQVRFDLWPHLRVGRRIRFLPKHVEQITLLTEHRPTAAPTGPTRQQLIAIGVTPASASRQRRTVAAVGARPGSRSS